MSETSSLVDWEQLDMIADGFPPDFVEIYREFELDIPRLLRELGAAVTAGDPAQTARVAHQAKGSAANFGFIGFSGLMARIETQAKGGSLAGVSGELPTASRLFQDSLAAVKSARGV